MKILLIDNTKPEKDHFTQQLDERLKELLGRQGEVVRCTTAEDVLRATYINEDAFDAAVLSGSSLNLSQPQCVGIISKSTSALLRMAHIPILGICFGMQLMCSVYGGNVRRLDAPGATRGDQRGRRGVDGGRRDGRQGQRQEEEALRACV